MKQPKMSARRKSLRKQYAAHAKAVKSLKKKMLKLVEKDYTMSDDFQQYREEEVTSGRGLNRKTQKEGRVYFKEFFQDEDDPKNGVWVERSFLVKMDGKLQNLREVVERDTRINR